MRTRSQRIKELEAELESLKKKYELILNECALQARNDLDKRIEHEKIKSKQNHMVSQLEFDISLLNARLDQNRKANKLLREGRDKLKAENEALKLDNAALKSAQLFEEWLTIGRDKKRAEDAASKITKLIEKFFAGELKNEKPSKCANGAFYPFISTSTLGGIADPRLVMTEDILKVVDAIEVDDLVILNDKWDYYNKKKYTLEYVEIHPTDEIYTVFEQIKSKQGAEVNYKGKYYVLHIKKGKDKDKSYWVRK